MKISTYLNLFEGTVSILLGIIGLLILSVVFFKIIPIKYRLSFIFSALIGSFIGYVLWMILVGPLILP